jgi:hypothetical protein
MMDFVVNASNVNQKSGRQKSGPRTVRRPMVYENEMWRDIFCIYAPTFSVIDQ